VTLGSQEVHLSVSQGDDAAPPTEMTSVVPSDPPEWQRWNDYGIGLLRRGQLRQAEEAFQEVEDLGSPEGPLNLARVYLAEGRVTSEAPAALRRARDVGEGAADWSILWFSALVNKQLGQVDSAISNLDQILEGGFEKAVGRGFDFSADYRLLNEIADSLYLRGLRERGESNKALRDADMTRARDFFLRTLELDPENADAHYGIRRVYEQLGQQEQVARHDALHQKYKLDDNSRDAAIAAARQKYPAANQAAERVVIFDLHRPEAYATPTTTPSTTPPAVPPAATPRL